MPSFRSITDLFFGSIVRSIVTVLVIVALALGLLFGTYIYLAGDRSIDFSLHQKVSAGSVLKITFPDEMDHESVEANLVIPDDIRASKQWNGNVLSLEPEQKLIAGRSYIFRLGPKAKKTDGTVLGRELVYTFLVAGAPVLAAQIPPADARDVPGSGRIALVFDRPMASLSQVQGRADNFPVWPVTISPALSGRWRWLGTTTAEFTPVKGFTLATKYTVSVPPGIKTVSGDLTEKDLSWSFETVRPQVTSTEPENGYSDAGPTTRLTFHFTNEMDLLSAKEKIILLGRKAGSDQWESFGVKSVKYGVEEIEDKKVTDKKSVVVVPETPYSFDAEYQATVKEGIRGIKGNLGSQTGYVVNFRTVGNFKVKTGQYQENRIQIEFTNPVNDETLKKNVVFKPPLKDTGSDLATNEWDLHKRLDFYPVMEPSTKYVVTLKQGLSDIFGQKLEQPFEITFTTPPLSPQVFIYPQGNFFSIFERGKPPVYYLNNVNVSSLDVEMGSLSLGRFLSVRKERQDYPIKPMDLKSTSTDYHEWHFKPAVKLNQWTARTFDIEKQLGARLKPGIYAISFGSQESVPGPALSKWWDDKVFAVTNMGMTLKYSGKKALVWVTDLTSGDPVAGATIQFLSLKSRIPVASGKTDKNGIFEAADIDIRDLRNRDYDWQPEFWVTASKGDDFAFVGSDWNGGMQPYDFEGVSGDFRSPQSEKVRLFSYIYTERPIYRVGDTMNFKGLIRFLDWNGKMTVPAGKSVEMIITDSNGTEVYRKQLNVSEFGSVSDSFQVADEAPLGYYSIAGKLVPEGDAGSETMWSGFSVLAYRKPEYKVEVKPDSEEYFAGDRINADVSGQYYFGAAMAGADVRWRAISSDYYFNKYTDDWYSFGSEDSWCWRNCAPKTAIVTEGQGALDDSGKMTFDFLANLDTFGVSQIFSIEADITDKNNQVVSSRADVTVHKSKIYVGLQPEDYGVPVGDDARIKVITLNTDGTPAAGRSVEFKLFSRTWNTVKEKGVDGGYYYDNTPVDTFLRSFTSRTDEKGKAVVSVKLDEAGEFRMVAVAKDDSGRESKAGTSFYAWADVYFNWPHTNNDRMQIIADKPSYKVGDIAKLIVKTPYQGQGVKALITVERENVISKKIIDVTANAMPVEVEITDELVPTAYVSVIVMKPRIGETFDDNGIDTGSPAFKIGYVKLPIDSSTKKLNVKIRTDKQKYLPGEKVTVNLEAVDFKGNPVRAELSLGVVDLSLLDLAGFYIPDLVGNFYGERGLGVLTSNMLTQLMERFKPGSKGGGGGEEKNDETKKRGTFRDTAYWNPKIITDQNGLATVSFNLPDNLTTWHFLALAATKDNLFGGEAHTAVETKPVILRPVRPRFAVIGDEILLGAIVHNYLDQDRTFEVALAGNGFKLTGPGKQKITIPKDGNLKVDFPVEILETDKVTMEFSSITENARDVISESFPVYRFGAMQSNALSGLTEDIATETVSNPLAKDAPTGSLKISIAPSLGVYLPSGLGFLAQYPYGCAEQIMSGIMPNVALKQLQNLKAFSVVDDKTLEKNILTGLQELYTFQRGDGGFGYWEFGDKSYPSLTAYILSALKLTLDAGYPVDSGVRSRARDYLDDIIRNDGEGISDPTLRAYVLFVLSEEDTVDVAKLNNLFGKRVNLPLFAKAHLAMAYRKAGTKQSAGRAKELLNEILSHVRISDRGARFEEDDNTAYREYMHTSDRSNAIILQALVRIDPGNPLLLKLVRGMLSSRIDGHFDTTQSTALSLLSFVEFLKQTKELDYDFVGAVELAGKKIIEQSFKDGRPLELKEVNTDLSKLSRGKDIEVKVGKKGVGRLYYDILLSYFYAPEALEPAEEGIGILREVEPLTKGMPAYRVGETYKVKLTITVPEKRNFVAVESPLPAGVEPIDLQFQTSEQNLLRNEANFITDYYSDQLWRFSHIELRDDRVFLFADELPAGVYTYEYLVRATTPGRFRERPAKAFEMYFPETFGQTSGGWVEVN